MLDHPVVTLSDRRPRTAAGRALSSPHTESDDVGNRRDPPFRSGPGFLPVLAVAACRRSKPEHGRVDVRDGDGERTISDTVGRERREAARGFDYTSTAVISPRRATPSLGFSVSGAVERGPGAADPISDDVGSSERIGTGRETEGCRVRPLDSVGSAAIGDSGRNDRYIYYP